jgi:hypothetical protein
MKIITRPLDRRDVAWFLACVICGLALAVLATVPQAINDSQTHYGTTWTFTQEDGKAPVEKVQSFLVPHYTREIVIRTNEQEFQNVASTVDALHLPPSDFQMQTRFTPPYRITVSDFIETVASAVLAIVFATGLFRILEKICQRILGVKTPTNP